MSQHETKGRIDQADESNKHGHGQTGTASNPEDQGKGKGDGNETAKKPIPPPVEATVTFRLSAERGRSTITPKDAANLALWGLPTTEPIVESPKWCFVDRKFTLRHVLVVYVNGVSLDNLLLGSQLSSLLLKDVRQASFVPREVAAAATMNAAFGGGGSGSGGTSAADGVSPFHHGKQATVEMAPMWVSNTRNQFASEFFLRNERILQQQQAQQQTGSSDVAQGTPGGGKTTEKDSIEAGGAKASVPAAPATAPTPRPSTRRKAGGLGQYMAALVKADQEGSSYPSASDFLSGQDKDKKAEMPARFDYQQASEEQQKREENQQPPEGTDTAGVVSSTMREDETIERFQWDHDERMQWLQAFEPYVPPAPPSGHNTPQHTPQQDPTPSKGGVKGKEHKTGTHSSGRGGGGAHHRYGGGGRSHPPVHLDQMVMTEEELREYGFELDHPTKQEELIDEQDQEQVQHHHCEHPHHENEEEEEEECFQLFLPPEVVEQQQEDERKATQTTAGTGVGGGGRVDNGDVDPDERTTLPNDRPHSAVAMDCEMVQTAEGSTLARLTLLACPSGACLIDTLVKPRLPVLDYVTQYSGITEEMLKDCTTTLTQVQRRLQRIITTDTFVIGHGLENDFKASKMIPNCRVIDTTCIYPHPSGLPAKNSLRFLVHRYFNRHDFQCGSHDSGEDAGVCIELVALKLKKGIDYGKPRLQSVLSKLPSPASQAYVFDRTSNVQRVNHAKSNNIHPTVCIDDSEVVKKTVRQLWRLRTDDDAYEEREEKSRQRAQAEEEEKAEEGERRQQQQHERKYSSKRHGRKEVVEAPEEEPPCTFSWAQLTDASYSFNDISDTRRKEEQHDFMKEVKLMAAYEESKRNKRLHSGGRKRGRGEQPQQSTGSAGDAAAAAPVVERPEILTVEGQIHQLNMRLAALLNACPHRTMVLVMAATCHAGAPNRLSAAHGACFAFVKDAHRFEHLPDTFTELQAQLEAQKNDVCAPS